MNGETVIIIGSSGHSKVAIDIFEKEGRYKILGLIDSFRNAGEETLGYKVMGKEADLPELLSGNPDCKAFIAIGDNTVRYNVMTNLIKTVPHIDFSTTIHPSAQIGKNVKIGRGVAIMAGVVISSDSVIGDFAILNTKSSLDHDSKMGNFSSLGPNATTGGNVTIGEFSAVSIGATIKHGIMIGNHSIIGAGSLLLQCCDDFSIMYGVPARKIRSRQAGEKYL
jgi:sugar O-acyltransferase (sialic acid O-acetyltransferase NeuD family)